MCGESTFVDRDAVSAAAELERTVPLSKAIKEEFPEAQLSIDTYKAEVAKEALRAGVEMVNDVTAGRGDSALFSVVAGYNHAKLVLMYAKDETSRTTTDAKQYDNVIETVSNFLADRIEKAEAVGVSKENLILDPGLGFFLSSEPKYSYEILGNLQES